ncbi:MAG: hypothetical protein WAX69_04160 [Victivallales bacterium]
MKTAVLVFVLFSQLSILQMTSIAGDAVGWNVVEPAGVKNAVALSFINDKCGVVGGVGGKGMQNSGNDASPISCSIDGGESWTNSTIDNAAIKEVSSLQLISEKIGYGIGNDGKTTFLLKTSDGGRTWISSEISSEICPRWASDVIWFADENHGFLFSRWRTNKQFRTEDAGKTWASISWDKQMPAPVWGVLRLLPVSFQEFYLVGNFDWILHTVDGGVSFDSYKIGYTGPTDFLSLNDASVAPDGKTMFLVGSKSSEYVEGGWRPTVKSVIMKSADAGRTWEELDPELVNNLMCVKAVSASDVWVGGWGTMGRTPWQGGVLLHSTDGGKSWKNENPSRTSIRSLSVLGPERLWAAGGFGGSPHEPSGVVISKCPSSKIPVKREGHIKIDIKMPFDGYLSLVIKNSEGKQERTLLAHDFQKAGKQTELWDGLDDLGLPVPEGTYQWKALAHRGIKAEYLMSYNCPNPTSWTTGDGKGGWGGDHGAPTSVCAVGDKMVIGFSGGESQPAIIVTDSDGNKTNVSGKGWPLAMATDGTRVYVAEESPVDLARQDDPLLRMKSSITRWNAANGGYDYFDSGKNNQGSMKISEWDLDQRPQELFLSERMEKGLFGPDFSGQACNNRYMRSTNLCGIACGDGKVFASLRLEDKVMVMDKDCRPISEIKIAAPIGIACLGRSLYVVSGSTIMKYPDLSDTSKSEVFIKELDNPFALTADSKGNIYVSEWGRSMQVKVFSPDGRLIQAIGKKGGRGWFGNYDSTGFLKPRGLAVDSNGRLWVADNDEPLKRISIWNPDGTLYKDLVGGGRYAQFGWIYPDDMSTAYASIWGVTSFNIDLKKKEWRPGSVLYRDGWHPRAIGEVSPFFDTTVNGQKFYISSTRQRNMSLAEKRDGRLWPIMVVGQATALLPPDLEKGWNQTLNPVQRNMITVENVKHDELFDKVLLWIDRNRDGIYEKDELSLFRLPGWDNGKGTRNNPPGTAYWGQWITRDLTLYLATSGVPGQVWRWPLAGWDENKLPIYRNEDIKLVFTLPSSTDGAITVGPNGVIVTENTFTAFDANGKFSWKYPQHLSGMAFQSQFGKPGYVVGTQAFAGWVDDMFLSTGYFGQFDALTEDGLYVAQLLKDVRAGGKLDEYAVAVENFSGCWFKSESDKKVYLVIGGSGDSRIMEVKGLDTINRFNGAAAVTVSDVAKAKASASRKSGEGKPATDRKAVVKYMDKLPPLKGDINVGWKEVPPLAEVQAGEKLGYKVRAVHDRKSLCLAYEVKDPSPMMNSGNDYRLLFKTGDAVDFMLGPAGERKAPGAGDIRLLVSRMNGKLTAVLYRPVKLPGQESVPATFASPSRAIEMERVTQEEGIKCDLVETRGGYVLKAIIPLDVLGINYKPGLELRGDFGVIYSDQDGARNIFRSFWAGNSPSTAIVNDIPSEAAVEPLSWGSLILE